MPALSGAKGPRLPLALRRPGRRGGLGLAPETRLALVLAASGCSLALSSPPALALVLTAAMLYAALELGPRALLAAWLVLAVMTVSAGAWLLAMAQFFEALRDAPPERAAAPFLRLAIMANAIAPLALNSGTAELMAALGRPKLPGLVKLPLMVAIRFVPTILSDLAQLREAAVIRLRGRKGLLFWARRPLLGWRVLMRPLLTRLIRSADDLAVAAELKGLRPDTPFSGERAAFGRADKRALAAAVLAAALAAAAEALARGA